MYSPLEQFQIIPLFNLDFSKSFFSFILTDITFTNSSLILALTFLLTLTLVLTFFDKEKNSFYFARVLSV